MALTFLVILTISSLTQTYFMYRFLVKENVITQKKPEQENSGEIVVVNVNDL